MEALILVATLGSPTMFARMTMSKNKRVIANLWPGHATQHIGSVETVSDSMAFWRVAASCPSIHHPQPIPVVHTVHRCSQFWCVQYRDQLGDCLISMAPRWLPSAQDLDNFRPATSTFPHD
jgi:hypothetical protein